MQLAQSRHLAYCTNVHRGETWAETLHALQTHTLAVKARVCPADAPFAIGLRLSDTASRELSDPSALGDFRRWLDANNCYIFTINGFPFGRFHGTRVKEQVYAPDWSTKERLEYTNRLFDLLGELLPPGIEGSVNTLPGSFRGFHPRPNWEKIGQNLRLCDEHIARVSERTGHMLGLAMEPETFGLFENVDQTLYYLGGLDSRHIGLCYDTCHFAIAYEEPRDALNRLFAGGIKIFKLHLSSALEVVPNAAARNALTAFAEDTYLHQVVTRSSAAYKDLDLALDHARKSDWRADEEWRIHFHIPLHCPPGTWFGTTSDHLVGALDWLGEHRGVCKHLEMETYTWEVLPAELRSGTVVDQLSREYEWTLARLSERGLTLT